MLPTTTTTTTTRKGPRREKNLVVRGGIYQLRKIIEGKPRLVSTGIRVGGKPEFDLAVKRAHQLETEINEHRFGFKIKPEKVQQKMRVATWFARYLGTIGAKAPTTQRNIQNAMKHLEAAVDHAGHPWSERLLEDILRSDCEHLLTTLSTTCFKASNSLRTFHSYAYTAFQRAVDDKILKSNPWAFARSKLVPRQRVLSVAEQQVIWPHLRPYFQRTALVLLLTGLRISELQSLTEESIDFVLGRVKVLGKGGKWRYVPLTPKVIPALREQIEAMERPSSLGLSLLLKTGTALFPGTDATFLTEWSKAATAAEVPGFTNHDLRRTFGTRCAMSGVPMKVLQGWMGHSDISITAKFYVHVGNDDGSHMTEMAKLTVEGTKTKKKEAAKVLVLRKQAANR